MRAQRYSDALLFGPPGGAFEPPFGLRYGINGVGLISRDGHQFIAVLEALKEGSPESPLVSTDLLEPQSGIRDGIQQVLPHEPLSDVRVLRIPNIVLGAAAGTGIRGSTRGTAGPGVTWGGTYMGFLTAGHVAHGATNITDASGKNVLGARQAVLYPGAGPPASRPNVDVALISTSTAGTAFSPASAITRSGAIDLHLNAGKATDTVVGMISWYAFPGRDAPDFVEVGEAGIAVDDAMRHQRRVQLVG